MNLEKEMYLPVIPRNDELVRNDVGIHASGVMDSHGASSTYFVSTSEGRYKF